LRILVGAEECAVDTSVGRMPNAALIHATVVMIFELTIQNDNWPGETTWNVQDECSSSMLQFKGACNNARYNFDNDQFERLTYF
jgi:hypothetical protein